LFLFSTQPGAPSFRFFLAQGWETTTSIGNALYQKELARRMNTSQSAIARLESGQTFPSTKTLLRFAEATGSKLHLRLSAA
jgi:transcriptional regulator with XRE-family HTH domain